MFFSRRLWLWGILSFCVFTACDKFERGPTPPPTPDKNAPAHPTTPPAKPEEHKAELPAFSSKPVQVKGLDSKKLGEAIHLTAGAAHTCVGSSKSSVFCWGRNEFGELGTEAASEFSSIPVVVKALEGAVTWELTAGDDHTCAILGEKRQVRCWGKNDRLQLGQRKPAAPPAPGAPVPPKADDESTLVNLDVTPISETHSLYSKGDRTCARMGLSETRQVLCWGGQAGKAPQPVVALPNPDSNLVTAFAVLGSGDCAVEAEKLICRAPALEKSGDGLEGLVKYLSGGWRHVCALVSTSRSSKILKAKCFGTFSNQLNDHADRLPSDGNNYPIPETEVIRTLSSGHNHSCLITKSGKVFCWGDNENGKAGGKKLGEEVAAPVAIELPQPAVAIAAGERHTCAALKDKTVWCWGDNAEGQLGVPTTTQAPQP